MIPGVTCMSLEVLRSDQPPGQIRMRPMGLIEMCISLAPPIMPHTACFMPQGTLVAASERPGHKVSNNTAYAHPAAHEVASRNTRLQCLVLRLYNLGTLDETLYKIRDFIKVHGP